MDPNIAHPDRAAARLRALFGGCLLSLALGLAACDAPVAPESDDIGDDRGEPPVELGATTFTIEDLGSLNGTVSGANAVNGKGEIAGFTEAEAPSGEIHAFLWTPEAGMHDLGTLPDGDWSIGSDIAPDGRVVGFSATRPSGARRHAVLWMPDGRAKDLGELDGNTTAAIAINENGQVAGTSYAATENGGIAPHRAFLWTEEEGMVSLGTLPGATTSWAEDLDRHGRVVGSSGDRAFLWTPEDGMRDLGTLGGPFSVARAINERGQVVGVSETPDGRFRAFLWTEEDGMRGIADASRERTAATDVNRRGHVVGSASGPSRGTEAFVWAEDEGMRTLELLPADPASGDATGINDSLVIVGSSLTEALDQRAVRWVPSREGASAVRTDRGPDRDREPSPPTTGRRWREGHAAEHAAERSDPLRRLQIRLGSRWRGARVVDTPVHHREKSSLETAPPSDEP